MGWNMPRWNELPSSLDERVRQLVVQLRRLKDRSGLSLASLQAKTGYSRTSWERYLNGKAMPPRQAVEQLAQVAGADPTRLLVLHEVALAAVEKAPGSGLPGGQDAEGASAASAERPWTVRRSVALVALVAAVLVGLGVGLLVAGPLRGDDDTGDQVAPGKAGAQQTDGAGADVVRNVDYFYKMGKTYPCAFHRDSAADGWSAGYSTTRTELLSGPGWHVVEAQCLLHHHHLDPGPVDGVYGQETIAAVARLQKRAGLVVDGLVGPDTWRVLRG